MTRSRRPVRRGLIWAALAASLAACIVVLSHGAVGAVEPSPSSTLPPPVTTVAGADTLWHARAVTLTFTAVDNSGTGIAATEYAVDGGAWTIGSSVTVPAPANHSGDGTHVVAYRSRDNAGGVEATQSSLVRIDTRAPRAVWRGIRPPIYTGKGAVRLIVDIQDLSGAALTLRVQNPLGNSIYVGRLGSVSPGVHHLAWNGRTTSGRPALPGTYSLQLTMKDAAGNEGISPIRVVRDQRPVANSVVFRASGAGRRVALTFDDGGDAGAWASILATLKRCGLHGAFFPTGQMVAANPGLARRTVAEGHDVGSHSWNHPTMSRLSFGACVQQLRWTEAAWWRAAKVTPAPFFRPPYGDRSSSTDAAAGSAGYRYTICWDVDPVDWSSPGVGAIISRVLSAARPGSVILMHTCDQTAAALPSIIRGLQARGLHPVRLRELLGVR